MSCRQGWRKLPSIFISAIFKVPMESIFLTPFFHRLLYTTLIKFRARRAHFLDLSKDNYTRRGAPTQTRGRPGGTGGQPVHCRIVAVGWPGPLAALVLFAHFPLGKVTAHPPPSSPDCVRGRPCSSAEKRKPPLINRDIFG